MGEKAYRKPSNRDAGTGVWIPTEYIKLTKSAAAAMLLAQIVHWCKTVRNADGWFYKTYEQWYDELNLTKFEVSNAIGKNKEGQGTIEDGFSLSELGVETRVFRHNGVPKVHYRVNSNILDEHFAIARAYLDKQRVAFPSPESQVSSLSESQVSSLSIVKEINFQATEIERKETNIKSSDDLILQSDLRSKDSSALDEELSDEAKIHRAYFGAFARSLTALEATSLEDYPVEDVLNAIEKAKAHTPKRPARYVKALLDSIITVPDHLKQHYNVWRACAFTTAPTKTPPPYDPSQDDVTRLERLKGMCSYDELFQFLTEKKQDAFWQDKVIALKFVQDNINTWKDAR